jgi:hypothetical protein
MLHVLGQFLARPKEKQSKERDAHMLLVCWATLGRSTTPRERTVGYRSAAARAACEARPNDQNCTVLFFVFP